MRISDWSSDVCSSDLRRRDADGLLHGSYLKPSRPPRKRAILRRSGSAKPGDVEAVHAAARCRSEEHTSELQSLMRISYAVFCLKKKKLLYKMNNKYTIERT